MYKPVRYHTTDPAWASCIAELNPVTLCVQNDPEITRINIASGNRSFFMVAIYRI